jgi:hypothetical protein
VRDIEELRKDAKGKWPATSVTSTGLVERVGAAVVPDHVEQAACGGGAMLGGNHGSSLPNAGNPCLLRE